MYDNDKAAKATCYEGFEGKRKIKTSDTNSVNDVISGIEPSRGVSPSPSFSINSCKAQKMGFSVCSTLSLNMLNS